MPQVLQGYAVADDAVTGLVNGLRSIVAPVLTELDRALVAYARDELGGAFTLHPLAAAFAGRVSLRRLQAMGRNWQTRGWLTAPAVIGLQGLQAVIGAEIRLQDGYGRS